MIITMVIIVIKKSNQIIGYIIDIIENAVNLLSIIKSKNKQKIIQAIAIIIAIQLIENNLSSIDAVMIEIAKTIYQYNSLIKTMIIDLNMVETLNYSIALIQLIEVVSNAKAIRLISKLTGSNNTMQLALLDKFHVGYRNSTPWGINMR